VTELFNQTFRNEDNSIYKSTVFVLYNVLKKWILLKTVIDKVDKS